VGGGFEVNKNMTIEGAIVMAPEVSKSIDTGAISDAMDGSSPNPFDGSVPVDGTSHEVTHSQIGYTVSLRMNF
jgi:long-chain fatty acid transport protein